MFQRDLDQLRSSRRTWGVHRSLKIQKKMRKIRCGQMTTWLTTILIVVENAFHPRLRLSSSPNSQIITAGCQQIRKDSFRVRNPHDLCCRIRMIEGWLRAELTGVLIKTDDLNFVVVFFDKTSERKSKSFVWPNTPVHGVKVERCHIFVDFFALSTGSRHHLLTFGFSNRENTLVVRFVKVVL